MACDPPSVSKGYSKASSVTGVGNTSRPPSSTGIKSSASSVTGVGNSNRPSSEHQTLGISHIIGPKWDKGKEATFNHLKETHRNLIDDFLSLKDDFDKVKSNVFWLRLEMILMTISSSCLFGYLMSR